MALTSDTTKSLGYLKKSLKMSKRALEINKVADGVSDADYNDLVEAISDLQKQIYAFEMVNAMATSPIPVVLGATPVIPVVPSPTAGNPVPQTSTVNATGATSSDDLLTTLYKQQFWSDNND